jgi:hypothetical protein
VHRQRHTSKFMPQLVQYLCKRMQRFVLKHLKMFLTKHYETLTIYRQTQLKGIVT